MWFVLGIFDAYDLDMLLQNNFVKNENTSNLRKKSIEKWITLQINW